MAKQIIQTNVGVEQEVVVPYDNSQLRFVLQFDDYNKVWFLNVIDEATSEAIVNGLNLKIGNDVFYGLGLDYGSLILTDTDPTNATLIDPKSDFGDRLKLIRDF